MQPRLVRQGFVFCFVHASIDGIQRTTGDNFMKLTKWGASNVLNTAERQGNLHFYNSHPTDYIVPNSSLFRRWVYDDAKIEKTGRTIEIQVKVEGFIPDNNNNNTKGDDNNSSVIFRVGVIITDSDIDGYSSGSMNQDMSSISILLFTKPDLGGRIGACVMV